MVKFKPPRVKITTIRGGRVFKRNMPCWPSQTLHAVDEFLDVVEVPQPLQQDETAAPGPSTSYSQQRMQERGAWEEIKLALRIAFYQSSVPAEDSCMVCKLKPDFVTTCRSCPHSIFCRGCAITSHQQHGMMHTLLEWQNEYPQTVSYQCTFTRPNHECNSRTTRSIKAFNDSGQLHTAYVTFCSCEAPAATLVRYGLWPCSAVLPATAVSIDLMDLILCLMMEGQVSLKAICSALKHHCYLTESEGNMLYRSLVGESMEQFRFFRHMVRTLADANIPGAGENKPMACPACPKMGPVFVSLDGNFGLVRKRSSGTSDYPPNHASAMFINDAEVQQYVDSYNGTAQTQPDETNKDCSNFQAGTTIRTKNQTKKLATTGVFGAACRHGIPLVFLNMEHGERLAYPALAIQKIMEAMSAPQEIIIMYDIACKLHAHLLKKGAFGRSILERVKLCLPIFHAYGHKRSCQILFGSKWTHGVGLTDGEIMERMWAFLRKFSHITKEMTPSHRVDLLTDALYYFTEKKLETIDIHLKKKMENAKKVEAATSTELMSVLQECQGTLADAAAWKEAEKLSISKDTGIPGASLTWQEKYVKEIMDYDALRDQLQLCSDPQRVIILNANCERLQSSLAKVEESQRLATRWKLEDGEFVAADSSRQNKEKRCLLARIFTKASEHAFVVSCKSKYAGGQTVASHVVKQLKATSASLRRAIKTYNDRGFSSGDLPHTVLYRDVVNPESAIFSNIQASGLTLAQKSAIDLLNKLDRAKEEEQLVIGEMRQCLLSLKGRHLSLMQATISEEADAALWKRCMRHLIIAKIISIEMQYARAAESFKDYVGEKPQLFSELYHGEPDINYDTELYEVEEGSDVDEDVDVDEDDVDVDDGDYW